MFVSKNIVQTSMSEDVFGTFAQMRKMSSRTRFVNNYFWTISELFATNLKYFLSENGGCAGIHKLFL
jgi:hypothetical protein